MWTIFKDEIEIIKQDPSSMHMFEDSVTGCRCAAGKVIYLLLKEPLKTQDKQGSWNYTEGFNKTLAEINKQLGQPFMVFQVYDLSRKGSHNQAVDSLIRGLEEKELLKVI